MSGHLATSRPGSAVGTEPVGGELLIYTLNQGITRSNQFDHGSEFGFEKLLQICGLLPASSSTVPFQVRHTFGFWSDALPHQKNYLPFFYLLDRSLPVRTPHNRQVEDGHRCRSSPSEPTTFHIIHRLSYSKGVRLFRGDGLHPMNAVAQSKLCSTNLSCRRKQCQDAVMITALPLTLALDGGMGGSLLFRLVNLGFGLQVHFPVGVQG